MWVKKFLARTLPEAMAQVKAELGPDAVILHTNQVKVGGIFGLFGARMIQVTAAADQGDTRPAPPRPDQVSAPLRNLSSAPNGAAVEERVLPEFPASPAQNQSAAMAHQNGVREDQSLAAMKTEMVSMKAMLGMMLDRMSLPNSGAKLDADLQDLLSLLLGGGIQEEIAVSLLSRLRAQAPRGKIRLAEARQALRELIRSDLIEAKTVEVESTSTRRVVALVGPTGVGKTTTLAKLAAHFSLGRRISVALVTADTYRIAAVEQLRTYSDILGVPLEVVYDPAEMANALARHQHRDLILVDTAGRSPRNVEHMQELQSYLDVMKPDETYLVVSMTSSYRDAAGVVDGYLPLGVQRFIFTKWDEAEAPGLIYNVVHKYKLPMSYITHGQNVPDDIEIANPDKITRAILGD